MAPQLFCSAMYRSHASRRLNIVLSVLTQVATMQRIGIVYVAGGRTEQGAVAVRGALLSLHAANQQHGADYERSCKSSHIFCPGARQLRI